MLLDFIFTIFYVSFMYTQVSEIHIWGIPIFVLHVYAGVGNLHSQISVKIQA